MNLISLFSVIIPTYHRNDLLAKCLDCLAPRVQTLSAEQYEVIVTDDGLETTAEKMIQEQYPWVKWVQGKHKGPAANRNNGAKLAKGEWLAFTDDDCLPDSQWLEALSTAIDKEVLALEGAIHPLGDLNQDLAECPVNLTGGCFWSANIAVERLLFEKIGGFDENYPLAAHEDQDLKLCLSSHTNILFVSDARVDHPVRSISLAKAVSQIPKRCATWTYHVNKHQIASNFGGNFNFTLHGYKFYFLKLFKDLFRLKFKSTVVDFAYLILGLPLTYFYLEQYD